MREECQAYPTVIGSWTYQPMPDSPEICGKPAVDKVPIGWDHEGMVIMWAWLCAEHFDKKMGG